MKTSGIILGVGAPNICRDGRKTMCAIILTESIGFVRVYPIDADSLFGVWNRIDIEIERHPKDHRIESYRILDYELTEKIDDASIKREILDRSVLKSGDIDPIKYQNDRRRSIALVYVPYGNIEASLSQKVPEVRRDDEECSWVVAQGQHWNKPYVNWTTIQGTTHKTHLVGREVYMGLLKNSDSPWNIFNNMQINSPDFTIWLLLGNMRNRPNVWVAPHVHRLKKNAKLTTQLCFSTSDGKQNGWPYCEQETSNVNIVAKERQLFIT